MLHAACAGDARRPCLVLTCPPTPSQTHAGAYQGRGRGNAFLNDLCDADVLVHVVDGSGTTDAEGVAAQPGEGADPLHEIM